MVSILYTKYYSSNCVTFPADYTPLPVTITISAGGTPVAGQSFTLTCQATTALSNPTYQWFDDSGTMIGSGLSALTISTLRESGSGEYSCQVTAGSGANQRYGCGVERVVVQGNYSGVCLLIPSNNGIHRLHVRTLASSDKTEMYCYHS